jgi:hypothetical protein
LGFDEPPTDPEVDVPGDDVPGVELPGVDVGYDATPPDCVVVPFELA